MTDNIVIVTGGFDPIHSGHIEYIKKASEYGRVIVGLNSDEWLSRKKGCAFMSWEERNSVLSNLKNILCVIPFDDSDNSAIDAIKQVRKMFPKNKIIFANGGDRTKDNIPEMHIIDDNIEFVFGVGGENKKNSSSWILDKWKNPSEFRLWGKFLTYYDSKQTKLKKLIIEPKQSISMQYHEKRSELWFVESGVGRVYTLVNNNQTFVKDLVKNQSHNVNAGDWHRLENIGEEPLHVIEIQYGEYCSEEDIIRNSTYNK